MKEQDLENSFEKQLRQKAADFRLKPSDDVWANVKISLQRNKRRRRFLWLWAAAVGLFVGAGSTAWYFMNSSVSTPPITITSNVPVEKEESAVTDLAAAKKETNTVNFPDENRTETGIGKVMEEHTGSAAATDNFSGKKASGSELKNKMIPAENTSASIKKNSDAGLIAEPIAVNLAGDETRSIDESMGTLEKEMLPFISFSAENISCIPVSHQSLIPMEGNSGLSRFSVGAEVIPLVSFIKYGTQGLSFAATATDVAFIDSVSKLSQSSGKPLIGFSTGINGQFDISKRFSLNAGIHFTQTGEKNSFLHAGDVEMFSDTASWVGTGGMVSNAGNYQFATGNVATTSRYNWLDFSLNGEWYFYKNRSNEISLFAGAGVSHFMSYTFSAAGYDKATLHNNSLLSNQQDPPVFHAYQLTTATGINYHRLISDRISLEAGFQFHYYLSSITLNDIPVTVHPYWLGINTGVSYRF